MADKTTMTRRALIDLCRKHGVMLLDQGDAVSIDAPAGYILKGHQVHSVTIPKDGWKIGELYAALAEDLGEGVQRCGDGACEICEEALSFEDLASIYHGERLA